MYLYQVWNSHQAWQNLAILKKTPKLAYRLAKYQSRVAEEYKICGKQREDLIYEIAGVVRPEPPDVLIVQIPSRVMTEPTEDTEPVEIDNPKLAEFFTRFNEFLNNESDLEWSKITMDELLNGLQPDSFVTEGDLLLLEPFFTNPE